MTLDQPLSIQQLNDLEKRAGAPLPSEIRELLQHAGGFSVDGFPVNLGGLEPFEFEALVPGGIPIATDGAGNFWVVDVRADGEWASVLFVSHDPPVVMVQAPDLVSFIRDLLRTRDAEELTQHHVAEIWKNNPHVIPRGDAVTSADEQLRSFARRLGDDFVIADLRGNEVGRGFVWGLAGPDTEVRRDDRDLLFATKNRRRGLLGRLFGN